MCKAEELYREGLPDYLNGDTYYHIDYLEHNLVRTKNQVALVKSQLANLEEMQEYIADL